MDGGGRGSMDGGLKGDGMEWEVFVTYCPHVRTVMNK